MNASWSGITLDWKKTNYYVLWLWRQMHLHVTHHELHGLCSQECLVQRFGIVFWWLTQMHSLIKNRFFSVTPGFALNFFRNWRPQEQLACFFTSPPALSLVCIINALCIKWLDYEAMWTKCICAGSGLYEQVNIVWSQFWWYFHVTLHTDQVWQGHQSVTLWTPNLQNKSIVTGPAVFQQAFGQQTTMKEDAGLTQLKNTDQ